MNVRNEIENYISTNENNGALLLTGKWGCGKTYLLKDITKEINSKNKFLMVRISLFGIDSIETFHRTIKESVFFEKDFEEKGEKIKSHLSKIKKISQQVTDAFSEHSKVIKGINTALSISWQDFFTVTKEIECYRKNEKHIKKLVLVFDDFERAKKIDIIDLMGAINEYSENREIKVILIADEEHMENEEYKEFKEKLISRTIKLVPNYDETIKSIVNNYKEKEYGYREFLKQNLTLIQKLFHESKTENLRSLKSLLLDFERVFGTWSKTEVPALYQSKVLYMFGAILFTAKSGQYKEGPYGDLFVDKSITEKYSEWQGMYRMASLKNWVLNGIWDEADFIEEIEIKFHTEDMSDEQKFLQCNFWDLEQSNITNGMPNVIKRAYAGDLCRDDIIYLLQKIFLFKKYNIPLPCDVDYVKLHEGFKIRKEKIRAFEIYEPKRRSFTQKDQIEEDAFALYEDIERFDNVLITTNNKKILLDYFKDCSVSPSYRLDGMIIGALDEKLMTICFEKYRSASNATKRDLARLVLNLGYTDNFYVTSDEAQETLKNILKMKEKLEEYNDSITDCITITNVNEYIKEIDLLVIKLNAFIEAKSE